MSRRGETTLKWADGTHVFRMTIAGWQELQDKCDAGPEVIVTRLMTRQWLIQDVRQTIRIGLIGGGNVTPIDAVNLVERYVDERPLAESVPIAAEILAAGLFGVADEDLPKPQGEDGTAPPSSPGEKFDGAPTTQAEPPQA